MYHPSIIPARLSAAYAGDITRKKTRQIVYRYLARIERTHTMNANQILLGVVLLPLLIVGCLVSRSHRDGQITIAPMLPALVVLETEPYYVHEGYHYHYRDGSWYYAHSRTGPWASLPRDRYPKEVRYRNRDSDREQNRRHDTGHR